MRRGEQSPRETPEPASDLPTER